MSLNGELALLLSASFYTNYLTNETNISQSLKKLSGFENVG